MNKFLSISIIVGACIFVLASSTAIAQEAKSEVKAETKTEAKAEPKAAEMHPAVPKHKCTRPEPISKLSSDTQQKNFVKEVDTYRDCLMAYRNDMNKLAKSSVDAANAAIEEFNAYATSLSKK
jgi:CHASE3 domain sensor protein